MKVRVSYAVDGSNNLNYLFLYGDLWSDIINQVHLDDVKNIRLVRFEIF